MVNWRARHVSPEAVVCCNRPPSLDADAGKSYCVGPCAVLLSNQSCVLYRIDNKLNISANIGRRRFAPHWTDLISASRGQWCDRRRRFIGQRRALRPSTPLYASYGGAASASGSRSAYVRSRRSSGSVPDCSVRDPEIESHRGRLCLSQRPLRYTQSWVESIHGLAWVGISIDRKSPMASYRTAFNVPHLYLAPPFGVTPFEFCQDFRHQKIRIPGLSCGVVCVIRLLAVSVKRRLVTNRRTGGQTDRQTHDS